MIWGVGDIIQFITIIPFTCCWIQFDNYFYYVRTYACVYGFFPHDVSF